MKIIECIPNISEGWSRKKVLKIAGALTASPGVKLLDICMDRDHHRSVLTFIGPPDAVRDAVERLPQPFRDDVLVQENFGNLLLDLRDWRDDA